MMIRFTDPPAGMNHDFDAAECPRCRWLDAQKRGQVFLISSAVLTNVIAFVLWLFKP